MRLIHPVFFVLILIPMLNAQSVIYDDFENNISWEERIIDENLIDNADVEKECKDSDGTDLEVKGHSSGTLFTGENLEVMDECIMLGLSQDRQLKLLEWMCLGGTLDLEYFDCEFGCLNGRCCTLEENCPRDRLDDNDNDNIGKQIVEVFLVNFLDTSEIIEEDEVEILVFIEMDEYIREVSYGKAYLSGSVNTVTLPFNSEDSYCKSNNLINAIVGLSDIDFSLVDRVIVVFPDIGCKFDGNSLGYRSGNVEFSVVQLQNPEGNLVPWGLHELGHNFGVGHANGWNCGDKVIDIDENCESEVRGDPFDIMGSGLSQRMPYNAIHREYIGWLNEENIEIAKEGKFSLEKIKLLSEKLKVLKIPVGNQYYVVENFDGNVLIHYDKSEKGDSQLLDLNPKLGTSNFFDSFLRIWRTFYDSINDISITSFNIESEERIGVHIGNGDLSGDFNLNNEIDPEDFDIFTECLREFNSLAIEEITLDSGEITDFMEINIQLRGVNEENILFVRVIRD